MLLPSHLQQEMTMAVYILFYAWLTRLCLFNSVLPFEKQNDIACRPELVITNSAQYFLSLLAGNCACMLIGGSFITCDVWVCISMSVLSV